MNCIAIIPARSGSKGLQDKNIATINRQPLIYYSIKAALESRIFKTVMVSTDSNRYAEIARGCGAEVPFLRSIETSGDKASTWDVVREVLYNYSDKGLKYDYVAVLQPTSPLRTAEDIREVIRIKEKYDANNVVTVTEVEHPVQWCFKLPDDLRLDDMSQSPYNFMRRQDLEKYYRENGAIYFIDANKILAKDYNFYSDKCVAMIMPQQRSIDIDSEFDLIVAESIMRNYIS